MNMLFEIHQPLIQSIVELENFQNALLRSIPLDIYPLEQIFFKTHHKQTHNVISQILQKLDLSYAEMIHKNRFKGPAHEKTIHDAFQEIYYLIHCRIIYRMAKKYINSRQTQELTTLIDLIQRSEKDYNALWLWVFWKEIIAPEHAAPHSSILFNIFIKRVVKKNHMELITRFIDETPSFRVALFVPPSKLNPFNRLQFMLKQANQKAASFHELLSFLEILFQDNSHKHHLEALTYSDPALITQLIFYHKAVKQSQDKLKLLKFFKNAALQQYEKTYDLNGLLSLYQRFIQAALNIYAKSTLKFLFINPLVKDLVKHDIDKETIYESLFKPNLPTLEVLSQRLSPLFKYFSKSTHRVFPKNVLIRAQLLFIMDQQDENALQIFLDYWAALIKQSEQIEFAESLQRFVEKRQNMYTCALICQVLDALAPQVTAEFGSTEVQYRFERIAEILQPLYLSYILKATISHHESVTNCLSEIQFLIESTQPYLNHASHIKLSLLQCIETNLRKESIGSGLSVSFFHSTMDVPRAKAQRRNAYRQRLLNALAHDSRLLSHLIHYAADISADTIHDIYSELSFLVKLRALRSSTFKQDARQFDVISQKPGNSLLKLVNEAIVSKQETLDLEPIHQNRFKKFYLECKKLLKPTINHEIIVDSATDLAQENQIIF